LWAALIAEKALKQICPQTGLFSGVAVRTTMSGCVFRDMLQTAFDCCKEV
jgi:hypothetical protein